MTNKTVQKDLLVIATRNSFFWIYPCKSSLLYNQYIPMFFSWNRRYRCHW